MPGWLAAGLRVLDGISEGSGRLFAWLILPLMGSLVFEVIARYFFNAPTTWAYDMSYTLYSAIFLLGAAYALRHGDHVRTDFIYRLLSARWQGIIDSVLYLVFLTPALVLLTVLSAQRAYHSWQIGEVAMSSLWQPPMYPFRMLLPIALTLLLLQVLAEVGRALYSAITGRRA
jgi:TRAP-type mannitol/chloroaromatic compound transport system permease small subunit